MLPLQILCYLTIAKLFTGNQFDALIWVSVGQATKLSLNQIPQLCTW